MTDKDRNISDTVAALGAILQRVEARVEVYSASAAEVAQIKRDVSEIRDDLRRINTTLHVGNGRASVSQRLFLIEQALEGIERDRSRTAREKVAVVVAIITTVGSVAAAYIATTGGA